MRWRIVFVLFFLNVAAMGSAQEQEIRLFPVTDVVPTYPTEAIVQELEGWVLVSMDVSARGTVSNIQVVDAEPISTFDRAALDAASRLQFEPYTVNNIPRDISGIQYVFRFELSDLVELAVPEDVISLNDAALAQRRSRANLPMPSVGQLANEDMLPTSIVTPVYPEGAQEQGIGGWVLLRFSLSDDGHVVNPVIEDSQPPGVFDDSALRAIRTFEYEPWNPQESTFERANVFHLFKYRP